MEQFRTFEVRTEGRLVLCTHFIDEEVEAARTGHGQRAHSKARVLYGMQRLEAIHSRASTRAPLARKKQIWLASPQTWGLLRHPPFQTVPF